MSAEEEALDFLNYFRNCHYADSSGTEEYKLALAINSILPDYCALRAQREAEKNEPLTLDELREMDGKPVWCSPYGWQICQEITASRGYLCLEFRGGTHISLAGYGKTWLAYRNKPRKMGDCPTTDIAKPMTNADRIRAMSDEKLSEYLADIGSEANNGVIYSDRSEEWLEWLQQPAKEGTI